MQTLKDWSVKFESFLFAYCIHNKTNETIANLCPRQYCTGDKTSLISRRFISIIVASHFEHDSVNNLTNQHCGSSQQGYQWQTTFKR